MVVERIRGWKCRDNCALGNFLTRLSSLQASRLQIRRDWNSEAVNPSPDEDG